jgi:hypothetical protein
MLADNMCTPERAHRIYEAIKHDLASEEPPYPDKWYCEMVYHTAFGDIPTAVGVARRLLAAREGFGDARDAHLVCVHVGDVLHIGGELAESTAIYERAYQGSLDANLIWIACLAARRLAWQHLETGRFKQAGHWTELSLVHSSQIQHKGSAADSLAAAAEIALADGRLSDAADLIERSAASWGPSRHARADASALALRCTLWIMQGEPEKCRAAIEELDAAHRDMCRRTGQDLLTARCARVHEALGDVERARATIQRYLPHRRDQGALTWELREVVQRLGVDAGAMAPHTPPMRPPPFEHAASPC